MAEVEISYNLQGNERELLTTLRASKVKWTKENCAIEALKYNTRNEFHDRSRCAHKASSKGGWLDEVCAHMKTKGFKRTQIESDPKIVTEFSEEKRRKVNDTLL